MKLLMISICIQYNYGMFVVIVEQETDTMVLVPVNQRTVYCIMLYQ